VDEVVDGNAVLAIGGSAGALEALTELLAGLPADLPAAVLVTLHIGEQARSVLPRILTRSGPLRAVHPGDGETLRPGCVYVAPPRHHLVVQDGVARLSHGPRVNRHRPAVDVMFAAAARARGARVVAVVLSGALDDGAVGAALVDRAGGRVVVQRPEEALFASMPRAALAAVPGAVAVPTARLGPHVTDLVAERAHVTEEEPPVSEQRTEDAGGVGPRGEGVTRPAGLVCPECRGALERVDLPNVHYYRCHVGHQFGQRSLEAAQRDSTESTLFAALAMLEEHVALARGIADGDSSAPDAAARRSAAERSRSFADLLRTRLDPP
jgi:two-component system, chemotaxis family, protein-glutamate methylesterase/glutaminase